MAAFLGSVAVLAAFLASTYGWGRVAAVYFYRDTPPSPAFLVVLGVALWVFVGGLLNSGRLAYPVALYAMFFLGLCFAVWSAYRAVRAGGGARPVLASWRHAAAEPGFKAGLAVDSLPILIVVAATAFVIATQLPTTLFNYHDDFHKYLVRPFRMLQLGTLGGGPFDKVGLDSVGAQSFLQSFILVRFPIPYVNGFDPVFAFLISGLLVNDIGRRAGVHWLLRAVSTLVFVVVNPQYVNISALFSGTMMILGLMYASFLLAGLLAGSRDASDTAAPLKAAIPFGLITAALIGLKITFMPFAALYFAIFFVAFFFLAGNRRRVVGIGLVAAATTIVSFGPWMALSYNNYTSLAYRVVAKSMMTAQAKEEVTLTPSGFQNLFSTSELYYGGSYYDYNFIAIAIAAAGLLCAVRLIAGRREETRDLDRMAAFAACGAVTVSYFASAYLIFPGLAIRYACPLLIAVLPASMLVLGGARVPAGSAVGRGAGRTPSLATVLMLCQAVAIGLFADIAVNRINLAQNYRTMLSFRFGAQYVEYTRAALGQAERERTREGQLATEEGETIFAWIAQPYHLDFVRNEILTISNPPFSLRFRGIEFDVSPEELRDHLAAYGIRYVMWDYKSFGMRSDESLRKDLQSSLPSERGRGKNTLLLKKTLVELANASTIVYNNGRTAVFDIIK